VQSSVYKCIVVEDEVLIRKNLVKKIEKLNMGFAVVGEVMDGESAINIIDEKLPHLVISDIQMPIKTGIDLIEYIYYEHPNVKVILVSGYNDFEYARQAIKYGVKEYLTKPISITDLQSSLAKVKVLLDSEANSVSNFHEHDISSDDLVMMVDLYINENYHKNISVSDISNFLHISPDYLSRVYKKVTGQSPLKHLISLRIRSAKQLLECNPELNVKKIGEIVGYSDQYYFSRIFKNYTGYYPKEYRTSKNIK